MKRKINAILSKRSDGSFKVCILGAALALFFVGLVAEWPSHAEAENRLQIAHQNATDLTERNLERSTALERQMQSMEVDKTRLEEKMKKKEDDCKTDI